MATWLELSLECLRAAKMLAGKGYWRSSVNRSYYAAYCAVTSELVARGVRFARGWNNPPHEQYCFSGSYHAGLKGQKPVFSEKTGF